MGVLLTLAGKDLKLLFRDKFGMFWIFAFPLMYAGFFGMIFGSSDDDGARGKLRIAVVDEEGTEASKALVSALGSNSAVQLDREESAVDGDVGAVRLHSLEAARGLVQKGSRTAYIRIPAGYESSPFAMFGGGDEGAPKIEVGMDPSRGAEQGMLQGVLMETIFSRLGDLFKDKEAMRAQIARGKSEITAADDIGAGQKLVLSSFLAAVDLFFQQADLSTLEQGPGGAGGGDMIELVDVSRPRGNRPASAFEITFPQAMVWGLMGVALGFAITLVRERTQGTLLRLRMAPIGQAQLLAGKSLACFVTCMLTMSFLLGFGVVVLSVRVASPFLLLLAMIATSVCFTGIMMTASVMGKTEQAVAGASWGTMMPFAMLGGGMIPLIAMPAWLVTASNISPFKWAILSMEGAVWRGFTFGDMIVPCLVLCAIGVLFFGLGLFVYRRFEGA